MDDKALHDLALENLAQTTHDLRQSICGAMTEQKSVAMKFMDSFDAARVLLLPRYLQPGEAVVALVPDIDTLTLLPMPADDQWEWVNNLAKDLSNDQLLLPRPIVVTREGFAVR
jgi:hypothetical protein